MYILCEESKVPTWFSENLDSVGTNGQFFKKTDYITDVQLHEIIVHVKIKYLSHLSVSVQKGVEMMNTEVWKQLDLGQSYINYQYCVTLFRLKNKFMGIRIFSSQ